MRAPPKPTICGNWLPKGAAVSISFRGVSKRYQQGGRDVVALQDVDLDVAAGEFLSVTGPSGSGKSTLLHLAGGLDLPSDGDVTISGKSTRGMSDDELTELRRQRVGFVFQFFNLLPTLTIEENVALPRLIAGARLSTLDDEIEHLMDRVGLIRRREHRPGELSGGEMQRAALARALIVDPDIVLADEPTGNLDSANGAEVLDLLRALVDDGERPRTVVMVTHDSEAAARADRQIEIHDGRVVVPAR